MPNNFIDIDCADNSITTIEAFAQEKSLIKTN